MFICEIWLFDWYFPQFCKSDWKCFRGSLRLRDSDCTLILGVEHLKTINFAFGTSRKLTVLSVSVFKNMWNKWKISGFRWPNTEAL